MGAMTSLLNPKLALVFLSVLPQFIDDKAGDILTQSLALGAALTVAFASVNACVAAAMADHPRMLAAQRWVVGVLLVALAVKLGMQAW